MPPTPLTLHILLALAAAERTASQISDQIIVDSQGTMLVSSGSFYKALQRLVREQLIEMAGPSQRYRITNRGRSVLKSERVRVLRAGMLLRSRVD